MKNPIRQTRALSTISLPFPKGFETPSLGKNGVSKSTGIVLVEYDELIEITFTNSKGNIGVGYISMPKSQLKNFIITLSILHDSGYVYTKKEIVTKKSFFSKINDWLKSL